MQYSDRTLAAWLLASTHSELSAAAARLTVATFGSLVTWSPKVFIPLTSLCRDVCHYCTFAKKPRDVRAPYMAVEEVQAIVRAGAGAGCREALFTLGDRPEARYRIAADWLSAKGYTSTVEYLRDVAEGVLADGALLPHLNPGVLTREELAMLRPVSASMGLMLESTSERLCKRGGAHFGSPDKRPAVRLATIEQAGKLSIPFTTGLLIGIGETRIERLQTLFAIRDLQVAYGHIQEVIVQNFRAKPGTKMATAPEPDLHDHCWTISAARLILPPSVSIQAPPNLRPGALAELIASGVNDWGGVSPVTPDHVNPEAAWPDLAVLERATKASGRVLVRRLPIGPALAREPDRWCSTLVATMVRRQSDGAGFARGDDWHAGSQGGAPSMPRTGATSDATARAILVSRRGDAGHADIISLLSARGSDFAAVCAAADIARRETVGDTVTFIINRNINYTNICSYRCGFCAFANSHSGGGFRDAPYVLDLGEIARRAEEAWVNGATEVCLQGGIHPTFDGHTYLAILNAVREAAPELHVHAFSPLEVAHGADSLGLSLVAYLKRLQAAGLRSLPGTAAEILDDDVRLRLSADKISVARWTDVMRTAHAIGLRSTATMMFGHVDGYHDWATHLVQLRTLQHETGGFTEFVPLPFVHDRAPIYVKGFARKGPTYREAVLVHAVARLILGGSFRNIQTSWTKMGIQGAQRCLAAGANDMGGTLMNESITRAAGGTHGQTLTSDTIAAVADDIGRPARRRTTLYELAPTNGHESQRSFLDNACIRSTAATLLLNGQ